jgi:hypothetical protein
VQNSSRLCENVSPMSATAAGEAQGGVLRLPVEEAAFGGCVGVPAGHCGPNWARHDAFSRPDGRCHRLDAEDVQGAS